MTDLPVRLEALERRFRDEAKKLRHTALIFVAAQAECYRAAARTDRDADTIAEALRVVRGIEP